MNRKTKIQDAIDAMYLVIVLAILFTAAWLYR